MARSSRASTDKEFTDDEYLYAQLNVASPDQAMKLGTCRMGMKKFQNLCASLHLPVNSFERVNAQRQFVKTILGTLLNSELQLASQNYQGQIISIHMSYPDKLPMLEVMVLDTKKPDDPDALIPLNSYRFNLNEKWEIESVSLWQQAYSGGDVDIIDTKDKSVKPKLRKVNAELIPNNDYSEGDFDEDYIKDLLEDIQFIQLDDHINAAFQYFNADRNKLRKTLSAAESDLKKLNEKAREANLPQELKDEITVLNTLLTSQQRLHNDTARDMGTAQAAFQEERTYNRSIITPLHNILRDMQEALNKQISQAIEKARSEEDVEISNPHHLLGYVDVNAGELERLISDSAKSYQQFREKVAKKIAYLRTEYPDKFDKISENTLKDTLLDIQKRIEKQPENNKTNRQLLDLTELQNDLQDMEDSNKAVLEAQQKMLSWVPQIKLNTNNTNEKNYINELKNASAAIQKFFNFYTQVSTELNKSRSYISDNTVDLILSTCNLVLRSPYVADEIKTQLVANLKNGLLEGCIVRDKKTGDYVFLSDKRRQDVEENYRDNSTNIDVVTHGLEHVRSKIVSMTAQLDFALNPAPPHPEDATLTALARELTPSSHLGNVVDRYNREREKLREASHHIASRIADIKKSPALRGRLLPTLLALEHDLTEVTLMQRDDPVEKNITDLTAYQMLEDSYKSDTQKVQAVTKQFNSIIEIIQKWLLTVGKDITKDLDFGYAFSKLNQISQTTHMRDKIAIFNEIILHDYATFSDNTISFRVRDWLTQLLPKYPLPGLSIDSISKKLIYSPEQSLGSALQNNLRLHSLNGKIAHELNDITQSQNALTTTWQEKQESIDNKIATATEELKQISEMRESFANSIEIFSKQKVQFELNFIRDLALYQETLTESQSNEANQKVFAYVKDMEAMITKMQVLQTSFDNETAMPLIQETAVKIRELQEEASKMLKDATRYQSDTFKPEVLQAQNEKTALKNWLFSQIRMLVVEGIPLYWNGKGTDGIQLRNQKFQIPAPVREIAEKILILENKKSAKSIPITEHDIHWLLDTEHKHVKPSEPMKKIYDLLSRISKSNLQSIQQLQAINEELSSTIEVALQVPASQTSLNKLVQLIQRVTMEELPFWNTQKGKNKFQQNETLYEHLPHRVMQVAESFLKMKNNISPTEKITLLLGKGSGQKGFFAERPSLTIRTAFTKDLYRAMTLLHGTDLSKEANVKMLITQFDNLQNTVNEAKQSLAAEADKKLSAKK